MRASKQPTKIRRAEITQAALDLVSRGGLQDLSVAAVAHACGLVPSAVYRHFKGKEEILDAAVESVEQQLAENIDRACGNGSEPVACLKTLFDLHLKMIMENRGIPRLVFSDELYSHHPDRKRRIHRALSRYLGQIQALVKRAQAQGKMNRTYPPATWSYLFLGLVQPAAVLWHLSDGRADVLQQAAGAWEAFLELARPDTPEKEGHSGNAREI